MRNLNNVPKIISESKSIGHAIDFKWTKKKINQLLDPLEGNEELEKILMQINHKASIGLSAALLEWVYWRFTGYSQSVNDTQKRIEALWCSINNREQTNPLLFDTDLKVSASGSVNGALWIALMNVRQCGLLALTFLQNGTQRMNSIWDPANVIPGSLSFQLLTGRTFRYCLLPIQRHR